MCNYGMCNKFFFLYLEWVFFFIYVFEIDKFVIKINDNKFI